MPDGAYTLPGQPTARRRGRRARVRTSGGRSHPRRIAREVDLLGLVGLEAVAGDREREGGSDRGAAYDPAASPPTPIGGTRRRRTPTIGSRRPSRRVTSARSSVHARR